MLPRAATDYDVLLEKTTNLVVAGVGRAWRGMRGRRWETAWRDDVGPQVNEVLTTGQETAAASADAYTAAVLAETGMRADAPNPLNLSTFAGVAGDGRDLADLTYGSVIVAAKAQYAPQASGLSPAEVEEQALQQALSWIEEVAATLIADAARAAETVAIAGRPWVEGYVRMIEPGACSRCVVLAGKFYLHNAGFDRHPACRCVHIPASEDNAESLLTNPSRYFDSLSTKAQDEAFTTAGAEAIRSGADISQVVNARRGMNTAQQNPRDWIPKGRLTPVDVFGRPTYITTEGVTKRGIYGKGRGNKPVRLMPESIVALATDRDDLIRLLRLYGYLS